LLSGDATIRCRPGLFFGPKHAKQFLDAFQDAVVSHVKGMAK
jgi:4-aminobutyrate aminotransferase-like enzyme